MSLQAPSLLAQLPQPLGSDGGKVQFGEVYGVHGIKKRKRHEIVAAIDGEGINIYNAQFPKLLSSYATPPQASHTCPPCSVRQRLNSTTIRQTYCAIREPKTSIKCFVDELTTDRNAPKITPYSFAINDTQSHPVFLGPVTLETTHDQKSDPFDVIVIHKDGRLRKLSSDLSTERWNSPADSMWAGRDIVSCFSVSFEDARKVLFRKRQDIVASILGSGGLDSGTTSSLTILVLVSYPQQESSFLPNKAQIHFVSISPYNQTNDISGRTLETMKHLMTLNLPNSPDQDLLNAEEIHWNANLAAGELSLSYRSGFISYDISQFSPRIYSHIIIQDESFSSVIRISPQCAVAAGKTTLSVYDTQYQSLQADLSLNALPQAASQKTKRPQRPLDFIAYFTKLDILIAVYGNSLLSFDLAALQNSRGFSRKRLKHSLLIDSVGKGIGIDNDDTQRPLLDEGSMKFLRPVGLTEKQQAEQWRKLKLELDELATAMNNRQFDAVMKKKFRKLYHTSDNLDSFPDSTEYIDPEQISFLLSKIFSTTPDRDGSLTLKLSFIPNETFKWLVKSKHVNLTNVQAALRQTMAPHGIPILSSGALTHALSSSGRSIQYLLYVLRARGHLDAVELVHVIKVLLQFARSHSSSENVRSAIAAHPDSSTLAIGGEPLQENGTETSTKTKDVLVDAMAGLNLALTKLQSQPLPQVSKAIRSTLPNSDVLSVIHHLRHSLATGGFTSRVSEQPPAGFSHPKIPLLSLQIIADLLTACIDAIGPSGWISASEFVGGIGSEASSLIADMQSEISAALAAIDDATYLKGILREFLRCCETATLKIDDFTISKMRKTPQSNQAVASSPSSARSRQPKRKEHHNGADIFVYDAAPDTGVAGDENSIVNSSASGSNMLPLSLKLHDTVPGVVGSMGDDLTKKVHKATGEIKARSSRETGYLKRKAIGKYSFERIVI
ncbi:hypothetical protein FQN57_001288 [Myotisia sp. PD_48]|nr:hypothetical protein FQN57_001288 [Myotisia sp. PD_48]